MPRVRRRTGAVDHGVRPDLETHEEEGNEGEHNLEALGALLLRAEIAASPLGRGSRAQAPDPREHGEVNERSGRGKNQHGDADCVLMESARGGVDAAGGGEGREPDGHANAAYGKYRGAKALHHGDREAGAA